MNYLEKNSGVAPNSYTIQNHETTIPIQLKSKITSKQSCITVGPGHYEIQKSDSILKKNLMSSFGKESKKSLLNLKIQNDIVGPGTYSNVLSLNNCGKCPVSLFPNVPAYSIGLKNKPKVNPGWLNRNAMSRQLSNTFWFRNLYIFKLFAQHERKPKL